MSDINLKLNRKMFDAYQKKLKPADEQAAGYPSWYKGAEMAFAQGIHESDYFRTQTGRDNYAGIKAGYNTPGRIVETTENLNSDIFAIYGTTIKERYEGLQREINNRLGQQGLPGGQNVMITSLEEAIKNPKKVKIYDKFRNFDGIEDFVNYKVNLIKRKYPKSYKALMAGNTEKYVQALNEERYYSDTVENYKRSIMGGFSQKKFDEGKSGDHTGIIGGKTWKKIMQEKSGGLYGGADDGREFLPPGFGTPGDAAPKYDNVNNNFDQAHIKDLTSADIVSTGIDSSIQQSFTKEQITNSFADNEYYENFFEKESI